MSDVVKNDVAAILVAGGSSERFGKSLPASLSSVIPKQFELIGDLPMYQFVARTFSKIEAIKTIVLVGPDDYVQQMEAGLRELNLPIEFIVTKGGKTRQESVAYGLDALRDVSGIEIVLVHDVARALVDEAIILSVIAATREHGSAIAAIWVVDTIKRVSNRSDRSYGEIVETVPRENLWRAQTPQGARISLLRSAFEAASKANSQATDESQLLERIGEHPRIVPGSEMNFKITFAADLERARKYKYP